jgi:phospholipase C
VPIVVATTFAVGFGSGFLLRGFGASSGGTHLHPSSGGSRFHAPPPRVSLRGIHKIQHVIIVMQENRSFDNYFGTFPGAAGIPMFNGRPAVCIPDPYLGHCVHPFHDSHLIDGGGPHTLGAAAADIQAGQMDGFIRMAIYGHHSYCGTNPASPGCTGVGGAPGRPDAVGWHDAREIPNYWAYAKHFVLQDHMFEGVRSSSLPAHLDMVSGWSASCPDPSTPMSCRTDLGTPNDVTGQGFLAHPTSPSPYAWTDLTYLLHNSGVSWKYYVSKGRQPDCTNAEMFCPSRPQEATTPDIWNPLPGFRTVRQDRQLRNIQPSKFYFRDARRGSLPAVSWVVPNGSNSEHPPASIATGETWVTRVVNAAMRGPDWNSTAIFLSWDDWGGFYDHVVPPTVNGQGFGLRVPGLVISPYAKAGYVDHQLLSTDSYVRFIEDAFLHGQRLDPATDGRPDGRPFVAENTPGLGNLMNDFNFNRPPRPPLLLPTRPQPGPASVPRSKREPYGEERRRVRRMTRSGAVARQDHERVRVRSLARKTRASSRSASVSSRKASASRDAARLAASSSSIR